MSKQGNKINFMRVILGLLLIGIGHWLTAQQPVFKRYAFTDSSLVFQYITQGPDEQLYIAADIYAYEDLGGIPIHFYIHYGTALLSMDKAGRENYFVQYPKVGLYSDSFSASSSLHFRGDQEILFPIHADYGYQSCGDGSLWDTEKVGFQKIYAKNGELLKTHIHEVGGLCEVSRIYHTKIINERLKIFYKDFWGEHQTTVAEINEQDSMYTVAEFWPREEIDSLTPSIQRATTLHDDYIYTYNQKAEDSTDSWALIVSRAFSPDSVVWTTEVSGPSSTMGIYALTGKKRIVIFTEVYTPGPSSRFSFRIELDEDGQLLSVRQYPMRFRKIQQMGEDGFLCIWSEPDIGISPDKKFYIGHINSEGELVSQKLLDSLDQYDSPTSIAFIPPDQFAVCGRRFEVVDLNYTEAPSSWVLIDNMSGFTSDVGDLPPKTLEIKLHPNPTHSRLSFALPPAAGHQSYEVKIYSTIGRLLTQRTIREPELEVSELPSGAYFLVLEGEGGKRYVGKFVRI